MIAQHLTPLPGGYSAVLNQLDLFGKPDAAVALRLAHAISEVSGAKGEPLLKLIETVWSTLRPEPTPGVR
ncbi:hypothetical protein F8568_020555 [Actinomadura sp. LD22]|uniref:Uncharacterized protein n=1 Tax=Actinomadura physcomitrii TaxID=2650748 RepID=A0A6I4MAD4_9ACTN|nr:hypothetical protein [Actinomadura physcomitrii]MWA02722.1 hypothetical protein [Actinomadura physcomitrii]